MASFYWDDLLEDIIGPRKVVPIIGLDLLGVAEPGGAIPFYRELATRAATILSAQGVDCIDALPEGADFPEFIQMALQRLRHRGPLTQALGAAHRELFALTDAALPEPLRLLAEITDFPLVLTTAVDGLVGRAFGVPACGAIVSTLSENADLPAEWQAPTRDEPPTLVHLFGRIAATPGYALTEEDLLEFMWNLQGEGRPARLLSRLRRSHILLLGTRFPDWLARFFLRLVRSERLSQETETIEALADPEARPSQPLVAFLQTYSPQTRIYTEGSAADFVHELNVRWRALRAPLPPSAQAAVAEADAEPNEMRPGAIFISYGREDGAAAAALTVALDRAGLDAWFDKNELRGGDRYAAKIRQHILRCDLFVPLMSRHTSARHDAFFRKEWSWARERLDAIAPSRPFIIPLVIDESDPFASPDLSDYFEKPGREIHVLKVPGGMPNEAVIQDFVRAIREVRTPRRLTKPAPI